MAVGASSKIQTILFKLNNKNKRIITWKKNKRNTVNCVKTSFRFSLHTFIQVQEKEKNAYRKASYIAVISFNHCNVMYSIKYERFSFMNIASQIWYNCIKSQKLVRIYLEREAWNISRSIGIINSRQLWYLLFTTRWKIKIKKQEDSEKQKKYCVISKENGKNIYLIKSIYLP